jgi:class 3 adenylate cyclase
MIYSARAVGSTALATGRFERRLAAILAVDVAGYSRLMGADEEGTLAALKAIRRELADPKIKEHRGRIVKTTGDGLLLEFASVVDAVRCAVEVQREMTERTAELPPDRRIEFRMGINVGDIIKDGRDIYGDGVNVAARLEALAEPGGICVSRVVRDQVRDKLAFSFEDMGEQQVKNIARLRKGGNRVRITAQLIDAVTSTHLWADRFDGLIEDVFELQDKVASSVAGVIEPALQAAETARSAGRPTNDLTAYDLYLRAYAMFVSSARQIPEALRLTEQAIARDPCYGPALAWAAVCCVRLVYDGLSEDPEADRLKGADFARRALEVAGDDPAVLATAAHTLAYFGEDIDAMIALVDRALALNPNYARGWHSSGILRIWAGEPDIAIEHIEVALRLSPRARVGPSLSNMGWAHFFARRFDEAVPKVRLAIQEDPSNPAPYRVLAACYAHMGRLDEAREVVTRLRAITSVVVPADLPHRNSEQRELYLSGLRLAAGETT